MNTKNTILSQEALQRTHTKSIYMISKSGKTDLQQEKYFPRDRKGNRMTINSSTLGHKSDALNWDKLIKAL